MTPDEFGDVYKKAYARARQQARRVLKDRSGLVEDAIQEAVLVLYPQLDTLDAATAEEMFVFATYYEARHLQKSRQREPVRPLDAGHYEKNVLKRQLYEDPFEVLESTEREVEAQEIEQGLLAWIQLALPRLNGRYREVLERRCAGQSWDEIARGLDITPEQVRHARREAGRRLRGMLGKEDPEGAEQAAA